MYTPRLTRRTALKLAAASLTLASCDRKSAGRDKHVAVIGAGIIGASIAYYLIKAGVNVTLLEQGDVAGRASRGTFAWINATWAKQPRHYHTFSQDGLSGWKDLQSELNIPIRWGGSLEWFPSEARQDRLAQQIAEQYAWGEPAEMIGPDRMKALEPNVNFGETASVAYSGNDGALDPVLAANILIKAAEIKGATIKTNCKVTRYHNDGDKKSILETSCGKVAVDQYVIATGANTNATKQLAGVHIPQRSTPGVIVITKPDPRLINRIIVAPGVHIHQRDDGRIVLGEQDGAPQTEAHMERLKDRPTRFPDNVMATQHANRILNTAETFVPGIKNAPIDEVLIGWRPLPLDGHPVLGPSPDQPKAYLAIMHSGVTLAPIVGQVVAQEIITGRSAPQLAPYRPNRSFNR